MILDVTELVLLNWFKVEVEWWELEDLPKWMRRMKGRFRSSAMKRCRTWGRHKERRRGCPKRWPSRHKQRTAARISCCKDCIHWYLLENQPIQFVVTWFIDMNWGPGIPLAATPTPFQSAESESQSTFNWMKSSQTEYNWHLRRTRTVKNWKESEDEGEEGVGDAKESD